MEGVEGDSQWGSFNNQALPKSEEELADEEQDDKTILQVALRSPLQHWAQDEFSWIMQKV